MLVLFALVFLSVVGIVGAVGVFVVRLSVVGVVAVFFVSISLGVSLFRVWGSWCSGSVPGSVSIVRMVLVLFLLWFEGVCCRWLVSVVVGGGSEYTWLYAVEFLVFDVTLLIVIVVLTSSLLPTIVEFVLIIVGLWFMVMGGGATC